MKSDKMIDKQNFKIDVSRRSKDDPVNYGNVSNKEFFESQKINLS